MKTQPSNFYRSVRTFFTHWVMGIVLSSSLYAATPRIFNSTESAKPGEVIGLQGYDFGADPKIFVELVGGSGAVRVDTISASNYYVACLIPKKMPLGLYKVWVQNGPTKTNEVFINKTNPGWALDLAGTEIDPGRKFRLAGTNLDFPGATSRVTFVSTGGGSLPAAVTGSDDPFVLQVTAPQGLVAGQEYDVYVSNGFGGDLGQAKGPRLKARTAGNDPWNLNVPWAAEFTFSGNEFNIKTDARLSRHAVGDSIANDRDAIQAAIDTVSKRGGGVLYLPAGTYNLKGRGITMQSNVVLKGEGMDATRVYDNSADSTGTMISGSGRSRIGFIDLSFVSDSIGFFNATNLQNNTYIFSLRSRFVNRIYGGVGLKGCQNVLIANSELLHTPLRGKNVLSLENAQDSWIRDSYIQWSDGRVIFGSTARETKGRPRAQIENNRWARSIKTQRGATNGCCEYGGFNIEMSEVAIINNLFDVLEPGGRLPQANDGETILNQAYPHKGAGNATAGSPTTLTDAAKTYTASSLVGDFITITQGAGMGQSRFITANTTNTVTVAEPWDVEPTAGSAYTIARKEKFYENWLVKGNTLKDAPRGIWIYSASMQDVAIVGNQLLDAENIYVRNDYRGREGRHSVGKNIRIEDNIVDGPKNWYDASVKLEVAFTDGAELIGASFYNTVVRNNRAEQFSNYINVERGAAGADNNTPGLVGTIFQGNKATNKEYAYYLNEGAYQTTIWNDQSGLPDSILVRETPSRGATHSSVKTVIGPFPDTEAPTAPANLRATAKTDSTVTLAWDAATDNEAVAGYEVFRDSVLVSTSLVTATSYTVTGLKASTTYTFTVRARDQAGNVSPASAPLSVKTPDTQPPTAPALVMYAWEPRNQVLLRWTKSTDNVAVVGYHVYRDGTKLNTALVTDTTLLTDGPLGYHTYVFNVTAVDAAGNESAQSPPVMVTRRRDDNPLVDLFLATGLYPNPNKGRFTIRITDQTTGPVMLTIYRFSGAVIEKVEGVKDQTIYQRDFNLTGVQKGVYFVRVQLGDCTAFKTCIIE